MEQKGLTFSMTSVTALASLSLWLEESPDRLYLESAQSASVSDSAKGGMSAGSSVTPSPPPLSVCPDNCRIRSCNASFSRLTAIYLSV